LNIKHFISALAIAAAGLATTLGSAGATTDPKDLSPANRALFTSDHMASIHQPTVLVYDFERKGTLEPAFTDTIEANVTGIEPDGGKDMSFHFMNGKNHIEFRDFSDFVGNPIFMLFLERDVRELQRLTRGSAVYFRGRIRDALAGSAMMEPTTFEFHGKTLKGTEIRIEPFVKDPLNERYPRFAKKTYVFILSDEIPGGFYKVGTLTPNPSADQPLLDESVTFREARPPEAKRADTGREKVAQTPK